MRKSQIEVIPKARKNLFSMDIHSSLPYPSGALSNFTERRFIVDGEPCSSMEGFIQSLKFEEEEGQRLARSMSGMEAKRFGSARAERWMGSQSLWWLGQRVDRSSPVLSALIDRAFQSMFDQCPELQAALLATGEEELTHAVGSPDPSKTALTENEFCSRLMALRERTRR